MDSTETRITFDSLPQAVQTLLQEVRTLRTRIDNLSATGDESPWMDIADLIGYLPGHPSRSTIYSWCANNSIPHHLCGKTLCFFRPEIDDWMKKS